MMAGLARSITSPRTPLAEHPNITLTRYPGLASHPTHEAARRQLKGFGTIISFDVRGDAADAVCAGVQLIQHATSLGAVESTIERRAIAFLDRSTCRRPCCG